MGGATDSSPGATERRAAGNCVSNTHTGIYIHTYILHTLEETFVGEHFHWEIGENASFREKPV